MHQWSIIFGDHLHSWYVGYVYVDREHIFANFFEKENLPIMETEWLK